MLLAVIAEKTGYPVEMLDLDMALDADLGIDSIKRVEILSALQERLPGAPLIRPEHLGSLQTLGQIVAHLDAGQSLPTIRFSHCGAAVAPVAIVAAVLLAVIAEKTGYPVEMLELTWLSTPISASIRSSGSRSFPPCRNSCRRRRRYARSISARCRPLARSSTYLAAGTRAGNPGSRTAVGRCRTAGAAAVATTLLAVIADKTGYPVEMLELDMALDADLGIDSIKRVEILSALQEELPGAPAVRPEHLGTLQTVGQIVDFLASVSGAMPSTIVQTETEAPTAAAGIERKLLKVVPLQGKGDRPRLELPPGAPIWVSNDGSALAGEICAALEERQLRPVLIDPAQLDSLHAPANLAGLILLAPAAGTEDASLQQSFRLLQLTGRALRLAGTAFLGSIARLNGSFGLLPGDAPLDPLSGGLAGLVKTAAQEWPEVHCKALDLAADLGERAAAMIVGELLTDGPVEVGLSARGLHTSETRRFRSGRGAATSAARRRRGRRYQRRRSWCNRRGGNRSGRGLPADPRFARPYAGAGRGSGLVDGAECGRGDQEGPGRPGRRAAKAAGNRRSVPARHGRP